MDSFNPLKSDIFTLELDETTKATFKEMIRWTKFLAIVGFIALGLIVAAGFFLAMTMSTLNTVYSSQLGSLGGTAVIMIYVLIAGIYFYPTYALYKYSTGMKNALAHNDKTKFNAALIHLKNVFKYMGVLMIIGLCIYGLVIIIAIIVAAAKF